MSFMDKIRAKATELGLDEKAALAKEKAAAAADANRDKIAGAVDKAGATVDSKTGGKYSDKISKAQGAALKGVDKVAEQGAAAGAAAGAGAGTTTGSFGETAVGSERAYDADLAAGAQDSGETATQRTIGQDGMSAADDQSRGENPVERAIGADAPSSSLDPNTSYQGEGLESAGSEGDFGGERRANTNGDGETPMRRGGDAPQS